MALALLASACSATIPEGRFACATGADCPAGWTCRTDARCWSSDVDAAMPDAAPTVDLGTDARPDLGDGGVDLGRPDLGPPDLGPPDLGPPCSGASACFLAGGATATGHCLAATTAACAPVGVTDCDCAPSAAARLFFDPPSGAGGRLQHVVVTGAGLADLSLQIDGLCQGGAGVVRCPVAGPCAALPAGTEAWVFPVGPVLGGVDLTTRGTHTVRVFASDTGAPCDSAPELMAAGFVIP